MKIENEFIPFEQALALKELGFDEECFRVKLKKSPEQWYTQTDYEDYPEQKEEEVLIPLWQQAFRWFREKYDLVIEPCVPFQRLYSTEEDHFEILEFGYRIYSFDQYRGGLRDKIEWDGYDNSNEEEAELECLKKLIELCKNQ